MATGQSGDGVVGTPGYDVFLRIGVGQPIQQFRAWDSDAFIEAQVAHNAALTPPVIVQHCTRDQYVEQRSKR